MSVLQLENLTKQFDDKTVVNNVSLKVELGEIYGLLGANGAGKTTTMRMVLGLIYPDEGSILVNGRPFSQKSARIMGYLPEERGLYPKVAVKDQIIYLARLKGVSRKDADRDLKQWLERFEVPEYYNKKVEELSKGNQQKIQFIAAIIHRPEILILDEAFSGLDPVNVELLKDTVKELRDQGTAILFSTHRMEHVEELCRNISILHRSNMVLAGNLKEIKAGFPKEHIVLKTSRDVEGIETVEGIVSASRTENGYELKISKPEAAQDILKLATAQTDVYRFEIMEPTLNEIFIRTAGAEHHVQ